LHSPILVGHFGALIPLRTEIVGVGIAGWETEFALAGAFFILEFQTHGTFGSTLGIFLTTWLAKWLRGFDTITGFEVTDKSK